MSRTRVFSALQHRPHPFHPLWSSSSFSSSSFSPSFPFSPPCPHYNIFSYRQLSSSAPPFPLPVRSPVTVTSLLSSRGLLSLSTHSNDIIDKYCHGPFVLYCGVDPTGPSLHIGHLLILRVLQMMRMLGGQVIILIGGATAMIGDPSGKSKERNLLQKDQINDNSVKIKKQINEIFSQHDRLYDIHRQLLFADSAPLPPLLPPLILDNISWHSQFSFLDFLRDVGKHFPIAEMLAKDSVKQRIHKPGVGVDDNNSSLSFTEFSYQLLQSYDFYHLLTRYGCHLQLGGNDQFGNITAGMEFIQRKIKNKHKIQMEMEITNEKSLSHPSSSPTSLSHSPDLPLFTSTPSDSSFSSSPLPFSMGICVPLLLNSRGEKIGKSVSSPSLSIWLSSEFTSPYEFYQFIVRISPNSDSFSFLRFLSFVPIDIVKSLESKGMGMESNYLLATDLVLSLFGDMELRNILFINKMIFPKSKHSNRLAEQLAMVFIGKQKGENESNISQKLTEILFNSSPPSNQNDHQGTSSSPSPAPFSFSSLPLSSLLVAFHGVPTIYLSESEIFSISLANILTQNAQKLKFPFRPSEMSELIPAGAMKINENHLGQDGKQCDFNFKLQHSDLLHGQLAIISFGKKLKFLIFLKNKSE